MPNFSGSFSGTARALTVLSPNDRPGHELQIAEITGRQRSDDPKWMDCRLSYWGITDLQSGKGTQRGYFVNEHPEGDRDWGTFEGTVTTKGSEITLNGVFATTDGDGRFRGITGNGTYKGRLVSPTEVSMEWAGSYQLAETKTRGAS